MKRTFLLISLAQGALAAGGTLVNPAQAVLWSGVVVTGGGPVAEVPE